MMKRIVFAGLGVAIVAAIAIGISQVSGSSADSPPGNVDAASVTANDAMPVEVVSVQHFPSYTVMRTYTGKVAARRSSELGFDRTGRLTELTVEEGDEVEAGDSLATLDSRGLEAKRQELEATLSQARAKLDEMVAGPRKEAIQAARAEVDDLREQLSLHESKLARLEQLFEEEAISEIEYDEGVSTKKQLDARIESAEQRLQELVAGTRDERIRAQQSVIEQLKASLAMVDVELADSRLEAPYSGVVAKRYFDEGSIVNASQPIVRLVEHETLEARIGVPVSLASGLEPGQIETVSIAGQEYKATVDSILPEVDPETHIVTVILTMEGCGDVTPGQLARLSVEKAIDTPGYWLPSTALMRGVRGLWACYTLRAADVSSPNVYAIEQRELEIVHTDNDRVYVRGTLQPDDTIVSDGVHRLAASQLVRPINGGN